MPGVIDIRPRQDKFIFRVEATGALSAREVVMGAFKFILGKIRELRTDAENEEVRLASLEQ